MPDSLPEPRVVPTPAFSPRMNLAMAVALMIGVFGLFVGLGKPPSPVGASPTSVDQQSSPSQAVR